MNAGIDPFTRQRVKGPHWGKPVTSRKKRRKPLQHPAPEWKVAGYVSADELKSYWDRAQR